MNILKRRCFVCNMIMDESYVDGWLSCYPYELQDSMEIEITCDSCFKSDESNFN